MAIEAGRVDLFDRALIAETWSVLADGRSSVPAEMKLIQEAVNAGDMHALGLLVDDENLAEQYPVIHELLRGRGGKPTVANKAREAQFSVHLARASEEAKLALGGLI